MECFWFSAVLHPGHHVSWVSGSVILHILCGLGTLNTFGTHLVHRSFLLTSGLFFQCDILNVLQRAGKSIPRAKIWE